MHNAIYTKFDPKESDSSNVKWTELAYDRIHEQDFSWYIFVLSFTGMRITVSCLIQVVSLVWKLTG